MQIRKAALGSAAFFVLAPGGVAGVIPWLLTRWRMEPFWLPFRILGVAVLVFAFARFVSEGFGTPAPVAPPDRLVVGGLYRYVRNPMYLAVLSLILGQALLFGQWILLPYAVVVSLAFAVMVHFHEEPVLRREFGAQYESYRAAVPGWWPRLHP